MNKIPTTILYACVSERKNTSWKNVLIIYRISSELETTSTQVVRIFVFFVYLFEL